MELFFNVPYIICHCGKIYFKGDEDSMWRCVNGHLDEVKMMKAYQQMFNQWKARIGREESYSTNT